MIYIKIDFGSSRFNHIDHNNPYFDGPNKDFRSAPQSQNPACIEIRRRMRAIRG